MVDQTPKEIFPSVEEFCRSVSPNSQPVFVPVQPMEHAAADDCFQNVATAVEMHGGQTVFGWAIWIWPSVWVKAEHHAVWQRADQTLVDMTPHINRAKRIIFLSDQEKIYDFQTNRRLDNIRKALRSDADIQRLFDIEAKFHEYEESHTVKGGLTMRVDAQNYFKIFAIKDAAYLNLLRKYLRRNDPCPCMSGKRVKSCQCDPFRLARANMFSKVWEQ
jgi:hypothetical protein